MCLSPIRIKNPRFWDLDSRNKFPAFFEKLSKIYNTETSYILVPCGTCQECIFTRQNNFVQKIRSESYHNDLYFLTLTYNNSMIPHIFSSDASIGRINYPRCRDVALMFKRIRKNNLFGFPFKYFGVSEYGGKRGRPHFHVIISVEKSCSNFYENVERAKARVKHMENVIKSQWKTRVNKSYKYPIYEPNSSFKGRFINGVWKCPFDFHYIDVADSKNGYADISFYVSKYICKYDERVYKLLKKLYFVDTDTYIKYHSDIKPHVFQSRGFGSIDFRDISLYRSFVVVGLNNENCLGPVYKDFDGKLYPVGVYLENQMIKKHLISEDEQLEFLFRKRKYALSFKDYTTEDFRYQEYINDVKKILEKPKFLDFIKKNVEISSEYLDLFC